MSSYKLSLGKVGGAKTKPTLTHTYIMQDLHTVLFLCHFLVFFFDKYVTSSYFSTGGVRNFLMDDLCLNSSVSSCPLGIKARVISWLRFEPKLLIKYCSRRLLTQTFLQHPRPQGEQKARRNSYLHPDDVRPSNLTCGHLRAHLKLSQVSK